MFTGTIPTTTSTTTATQCISGVVSLDQTGLLGAVTGVITPLLGTPIRIRQVVGPAGGPVSLTRVDGRFATVCGRFVHQTGNFIFDVTTVIPGTPHPFSPTPPNNQLLLLLLLLLLLRGGASPLPGQLGGLGLGTAGAGLAGLNPLSLLQNLGLQA